MTRYVVYFASGACIPITATTYTEAAIKATQKYPRRTVVKIVRKRDGRTVVTNW